MPELGQAVRLVLFAKLKCILIESVSYYSIDYCPDARDNITCSRFDKFNHVKYTKTLSVRNPRTVYFMSFHEGKPTAIQFRSIAAITFDSLRVLLRLKKQARTSLRIAFRIHFIPKKRWIMVMAFFLMASNKAFI